MRFLKTKIAIISLGLFISSGVSADVVINEIMYDLSGTDTGREWVEIANKGDSAVIIATTTWKFFESDTNHGLTLFQGNQTLSAGGFAIIADNPQKFLLDWPNFSGTIFDSVFSLGNVSEIIALKSSTTTISDQVSYNSGIGANGDGNSLQKVGDIWKALSPTPGLANSSGNGTADTATSLDQTTATTTADAPVSGSAPETGASASSDTRNTTNWPVEPQIMSRIVGPSIAISGADIIMKGEALGLDKKPLENPRFVWNFGDGFTKEGESVMHSYNFPGDYVVILNVSSGRFDSESRLKISVASANLSIGGVVAGTEGKIELVNGGNRELDLSWWRIQNGGNFFTLPKNTKILPNARLPFAAAVLGFSVNADSVSLLYPNGAVAYKFENKAAAAVPPVSTPISESENAILVPVAQNQSVSVINSKTVSPVSALSQTVSVINAIQHSTGTVAKTADNQKSGSSSWFYGVAGVIILGLGFILWPKPEIAVSKVAPKSEVDEYNIVED